MRVVEQRSIYNIYLHGEMLLRTRKVIISDDVEVTVIVVDTEHVVKVIIIAKKVEIIPN